MTPIQHLNQHAFELGAFAFTMGDFLNPYSNANPKDDYAFLASREWDRGQNTAYAAFLYANDEMLAHELNGV